MRTTRSRSISLPTFLVEYKKPCPSRYHVLRNLRVDCAKLSALFISSSTPLSHVIGHFSFTDWWESQISANFCRNRAHDFSTQYIERGLSRFIASEKQTHDSGCNDGLQGKARVDTKKDEQISPLGVSGVLTPCRTLVDASSTHTPPPYLFTYASFHQISGNQICLPIRMLFMCKVIPSRTCTKDMSIVHEKAWIHTIIQQLLTH